MKNYDGDTITFNIPQVPAIVGRNMHIRLRGIDAPELNKARCTLEKEKALEARKLVHKLLQGATTINLLHTGRGKYFRMLADVEFDGRDLATILLRRGLAVSYLGGKRENNWCGKNIATPSAPRPPAVLPPKISGVYIWPPPPVAKRKANEQE